MTSRVRREASPRPPARPGTVPLARALSKLGLATRTEARALVLDGRVSIDGRTHRDPEAPVIPERIRVCIDGRDTARPEPLTLVLHKPRGVITTKRDPDGRPTVYDCVAAARAHLVPVGRLDAATSGVLLMTNDTRLADWLTDPANAVPRVYLVTVRGRVNQEDARRLEQGVLDRGERLVAARATVRKASGRESLLIVELVEGKNREVRRLLRHIGYDVTRLRRVQFGGLTVEGLAAGAWREVPRDELARVFPGAPLSRASHVSSRSR